MIWLEVYCQLSIRYHNMVSQKKEGEGRVRGRGRGRGRGEEEGEGEGRKAGVYSMNRHADSDFTVNMGLKAIPAFCIHNRRLRTHSAQVRLYSTYCDVTTSPTTLLPRIQLGGGIFDLCSTYSVMQFWRICHDMTRRGWKPPYLTSWHHDI